RVLTPDTHTLSHLMRLKIDGFLQGSDNQVVIQSALSAGIDGVVMPFVSPAIISATVRHKHSLLDLVHPKYPVRRLLAKYRFAEPRTVNQTRSYDLSCDALEQAIAARLDESRIAIMHSSHGVGVS
ncbi:MAG: hypothetical protein AAB305_06720, partial [Candidatus Zixiibacteriota bacterium]